MIVYYQCEQCHAFEARDRPRSHFRARAACTAPFIRPDGTAVVCGGPLRYVSHKVPHPND